MNLIDLTTQCREDLTDLNWTHFDSLFSELRTGFDKDDSFIQSEDHWKLFRDGIIKLLIKQLESFHNFGAFRDSLTDDSKILWNVTHH